MQHPEMVASVYTDSAWVTPSTGGIFEGTEAITAWLTGSTAPAPTIEVAPLETLIMGDRAVAMGTYRLSVTGEAGETMVNSGAYLNALEKVDGEWKIAGMMSNFDAPPPEDLVWNPMPGGDMPTGTPRFPDINAAYTAAFNAGDAAAIASMYAEDARFALSNGPILEGRAAIEEAMAARLIPGATIDIQEVGSEDMGDGWSGGGGWYAITGPDGAVAQTGFWMNVIQVQDDGTPQIAWGITNARPGGM
jgi:ketosteroid isomerase-like protein